MKTISEWFETLHEPVRSKALKNYDGRVEKTADLKAAIYEAFSWHDTPEGFQYWMDRYTEVAESNLPKPYDPNKDPLPADLGSRLYHYIRPVNL